MPAVRSPQEMLIRQFAANAMGFLDVGIGDDIELKTGLTKKEIGDGVVSVFHDLTDGGANVLLMGGVRVYVRRRGNVLDIGSRKDFAKLGWEDICSMLDQTVDPKSN